MSGPRFALILILTISITIFFASATRKPDPSVIPIIPTAEQVYSQADYLTLIDAYNKVGDQYLPCFVSGFLININDEPFIATAAHLIASRPEDLVGSFVLFKSPNVSSQPAVFVGYDKLIDIALFKLVGDQLNAELLNICARLGNSDKLLVGQKVYALGMDSDIWFSFAEGRIKNLSFGNSTYNYVTERLGFNFYNQPQVIVHSALFNPGGSGGPLVNEFGEVVGINVMLRRNYHIYSVAVPINDCKTIWHRILEEGQIDRPQIPFILATDQAQQPRESGPIVIFVYSFYADSNLKIGDVIRDCGKRKINTTHEMMRIILVESKSDDTLPLTIERDGEILKINLRLKKFQPPISSIPTP